MNTVLYVVRQNGLDVIGPIQCGVMTQLVDNLLADIGNVRTFFKNQNGVFILTRAAAALGITDEIIELLLDMFAESGIIKINSREEDLYKIEAVSGKEIQNIAETSKYEEFTELMNTINEYKNSFMKIEIERN